jgi:hypothetical protein
MRVCAKTRCDAPPIATVALVYISREVVVEDLTTQRDPAVIDLCREHLERMVAPRGWSVRDERTLIGAVAGD